MWCDTWGINLVCNGYNPFVQFYTFHVAFLSVFGLSLSAPFNDASSSLNHVTSVTDKSVSMEHWWNDIDRRKPLPVPLCPPQVPRGLAWDWSWASAVGGQQLTSWDMAGHSGVIARWSHQLWYLKVIISNNWIQHVTWLFYGATVVSNRTFFSTEMPAFKIGRTGASVRKWDYMAHNFATKEPTLIVFYIRGFLCG
jgi:hypothetical protein